MSVTLLHILRKWSLRLLIKFVISSEPSCFRYKKNAKIASELFKDRPMTPAMTVDYWTRYVIRHKGAPHLKSHALTLKWYQYLLLDVIAALALIFLLVAYVTYLVSKTLYKYFIFKFGKVKAE